MKSSLIGVVVCAIVGLILFFQTLHCNDVDKLQIIQNIDGSIEVRREGGWYPRIFPRIWTYPKASVEICNESDRDAIKMQFANKTTASLACQIGYRIDSTNDVTVLKLHQLVEGSDDKIWKIVQTSLQTAVQRIASQYTPSESVEKFDEFSQKIAKAIIHDPELLEKGIDVVSFTCAGLPKYDAETQAQFNKQKEADLAKRLAEAEKIKLEAEKLKVEANYQMQIAEQKGQAEADMAKQVQAAEKEKKLAEIAAQKQVEVEKLAKEQMLIQMQKEKEAAAIQVEKEKEVAKIQAEKLFEVAEIQKKTEAANLEAIRLQAEQKVVTANARAKELEMSKALSETERAKIDLELGKERVKWESIGKAFSTMKLPQIMNFGGANGNSQNSLDMLIQTLTLNNLNQQVFTPKK